MPFGSHPTSTCGVERPVAADLESIHHPHCAREAAMADDFGHEATARPVDADNHYHETLDAFTRHLDPAFRQRGVQVVRDGRHVELVIGGRLNSFIPNPTFDPIIVPGCLDLQFRGHIPEGVDPRSLTKVEPTRPEYRDRDARLARMDAQGLDAVLLFPTLGCGVEQALRNDVPATMASLIAFNRWLEDDWGYFYEERILAAPMISLADPDAALAEVDRCSRSACASSTCAPRRCRRGRAAAGRWATGPTTRSGPVSPRPASPSRSTSATAATTPC
jgi:hypothetical protein